MVPGHWQDQFDDLARATGTAWYRLPLDLDASWLAHGALTLEFGAVGHFCQGWLNGAYLGQHEGGHLPFSWPIDHTAVAGTNELLVRVVSPSGDRSRFPEFPFEETLHGKQSWYGPSGGIWQEVRVEARSAHAVLRTHGATRRRRVEGRCHHSAGERESRCRPPSGDRCADDGGGATSDRVSSVRPRRSRRRSRDPALVAGVADAVPTSTSRSPSKVAWSTSSSADSAFAPSPRSTAGSSSTVVRL